MKQNINLNEIVNRIGYFRNKHNLSARELSLRIGKHEGYINKLESKDFNLPALMLLEIIDALEISYSEFFAENYTSYNTDNQLYSLIQSLPQDKKQHIIEFLKKWFLIVGKKWI